MKQENEYMLQYTLHHPIGCRLTLFNGYRPLGADLHYPMDIEFQQYLPGPCPGGQRKEGMFVISSFMTIQLGPVTDINNPVLFYVQ
jgi:hypothetical protein